MSRSGTLYLSPFKACDYHHRVSNPVVLYIGAPQSHNSWIVYTLRFEVLKGTKGPEVLFRELGKWELLMFNPLLHAVCDQQRMKIGRAHV